MIRIHIYFFSVFTYLEVYLLRLCTLFVFLSSLQTKTTYKKKDSNSISIHICVCVCVLLRFSFFLIRLFLFLFRSCFLFLSLCYEVSLGQTLADLCTI